MLLMGLLVDWTQERKQSVSLKICQYKLPKLKHKEEKKNTQTKTEQNIQELWDNYESSTYIIEISREEKKNRRNIWIIAENFPK